MYLKHILNNRICDVALAIIMLLSLWYCINLCQMYLIFDLRIIRYQKVFLLVWSDSLVAFLGMTVLGLDTPRLGYYLSKYSHIIICLPATYVSNICLKFISCVDPVKYHFRALLPVTILKENQVASKSNVKQIPIFSGRWSKPDSKDENLVLKTVSQSIVRIRPLP